jgi:hypothetical protein
VSDVPCTTVDVLGFLYSHLVHPSLRIILLSLGQGRASITVWWCSSSCSWGGWSTSIETLDGKVTWLSTVETNLAWFHWRRTLSSWGLLHILIFSGRGPLSTLIHSIWGLKEVTTWNHLSLWGDKSLSSWLRHPLTTLLHRAEGRSSRWRSNSRTRVATLLTLAPLLALGW